MSDQPVAWGIPRPDGLILDVICPDEHEAYEGQYTVPLYAAPQPKAEPTLESVYETIIHWDEGGGKRSRRELARRIVALYTAPQPKAEQCWCLTCRPITMDDMRFVVCPDCGNKRCPKANDHRNACTNSNEPGQPGSAYPAPQPRKRLTDEQIIEWVESGEYNVTTNDWASHIAFARAIEAAVWGDAPPKPA